MVFPNNFAASCAKSHLDSPWHKRKRRKHHNISWTSKTLRKEASEPRGSPVVNAYSGGFGFSSKRLSQHGPTECHSVCEAIQDHRNIMTVDEEKKPFRHEGEAYGEGPREPCRYDLSDPYKVNDSRKNQPTSYGSVDVVVSSSHKDFTRSITPNERNHLMNIKPLNETPCETFTVQQNQPELSSCNAAQGDGESSTNALQAIHFLQQLQLSGDELMQLYKVVALLEGNSMDNNTMKNLEQLICSIQNFRNPTLNEVLNLLLQSFLEKKNSRESAARETPAKSVESFNRTFHGEAHVNQDSAFPYDRKDSFLDISKDRLAMNSSMGPIESGQEQLSLRNLTPYEKFFETDESTCGTASQALWSEPGFEGNKKGTASFNPPVTKEIEKKQEICQWRNEEAVNVEDQLGSKEKCRSGINEQKEENAFIDQHFFNRPPFPIPFKEVTKHLKSLDKKTRHASCSAPFRSTSQLIYENPRGSPLVSDSFSSLTSYPTKEINLTLSASLRTRLECLSQEVAPFQHSWTKCLQRKEFSSLVALLRDALQSSFSPSPRVMAESKKNQYGITPSSPSKLGEVHPAILTYSSLYDCIVLERLSMNAAVYNSFNSDTQIYRIADETGSIILLIQNKLSNNLLTRPSQSSLFSVQTPQDDLPIGSVINLRDATLDWVLSQMVLVVPSKMSIEFFHSKSVAFSRTPDISQFYAPPHEDPKPKEPHLFEHPGY